MSMTNTAQAQIRAGDILATTAPDGHTCGGTPVWLEIVGRATQVIDLLDDGKPLICYRPLSIYCYVQGYTGNGRYLPIPRDAERSAWPWECRPASLLAQGDD